MKALVIGFGKMGMLHAATLNSLESVEEVILVENTGLVCEGIRAFNPSIKIYKTYEEALEKEAVDFAVIATPTHTHFDILAGLLRRGIHTFVEKPLVASFDEAKKALQAQKNSPKKDVKVMAGYCLRFVPTFLKAKEALEQGQIGEIFHFEAKMYSSDVEESHGGWRFQKKQKGGGVLLDLGGHLVDLTRFLFGMPEQLIAATESWHSKDVEDYVFARFGYKKFSGNLEACWSMPGIRKADVQIQVTGSKGTLTVSNDHLEYGSYSADISSMAEAVPFDLAGFFYTKQWLEFIDCIQKNKMNRNNLAESLEDHFLLDQILESNLTLRALDKIKR